MPKPVATDRRRRRRSWRCCSLRFPHNEDFIGVSWDLLGIQWAYNHTITRINYVDITSKNWDLNQQRLEFSTSWHMNIVFCLGSNGNIDGKEKRSTQLQGPPPTGAELSSFLRPGLLCQAADGIREQILTWHLPKQIHSHLMTGNCCQTKILPLINHNHSLFTHFLMPRKQFFIFFG